MAGLRWCALVFVLLGLLFGGASAAGAALSLPCQPTASSLLITSARTISPASVTQDQLMAHIQALQDVGTRHVNSGHNLPGFGIEAAYDYVNAQFVEIQRQAPTVLVWSHEFRAWWNYHEAVLRNIIFELPGTDSSAGVIVVGAHYDSISYDYNDAYAYAPGANDNASGVAALIEMGRILSQTPHRKTILLVAFAAEEIGIKGSAAFVHDYIQACQIPVDAMINMDIIGSSTGTYGNVNTDEIRLFSAEPEGSPSRQLARALADYAASDDANLHIMVQDAVDRRGRFGDHQSFSNAGYSAVRFTAAEENVYHEHSTMDLISDVDPAYLERATRTILTVVTTLAG